MSSVALTREEAKRQQRRKKPAAARKPRRPRQPRQRRGAVPNTFIPWSDKETGKNVLKDYIEPDATLRPNTMLEIAYKSMLEMLGTITYRAYNTIQMARLHFDKYGEIPFDLNDIMRA